MLCQSLREDAFIAATLNFGTRVGGSSPVSCSNTDIHSKGWALRPAFLVAIARTI
jgi:hypothetical protein